MKESLFTAQRCCHNAFVKSFEIKSISDGLPLQGYHWCVQNPIAAVSLVHGFGEHCGRYRNLVEHLNNKRINVVGVDLRGHGQTQGRRGISKSYTEIANDVTTLVEETSRLYPELPRFLFGHSLGGGLVLHHGMTTQADSLSGYLVSAPLIIPKRPIPKVLRWFVKLMRFIRPNGSMPIPVSGKKISTIPEEQVRYDNDSLNHNRLGFGLAVGMVEAGEDLYAEADQWSKPLRMWHSNADQITDYEASNHFAEEAENCQFTTFEDVQHEMHQDRSRDAVYELMVEFVQSQLK